MLIKSIFWLVLILSVALTTGMSYKKNDQDIYEAGESFLLFFSKVL